MFKEKYLIFQRSNPELGAIKNSPKSSPPSEPDSFSTKRNDQMPGSPLEKAKQLAYQMIDDVFGKENRRLVISQIGPFDEVVKDLKQYSALKYKGTRIEYGQTSLMFDRVDQNQELKLAFSTVFYITEEEFNNLLALTKAKPIDTMALEDRANRYIDGPVVQMILNYGPEDMPDDILDHILETSLIRNVRKNLIESYKRGKPYLITTITGGFKLETDEPKDSALTDKKYDMDKFWRDMELLKEKTEMKPLTDTKMDLEALREYQMGSQSMMDRMFPVDAMKDIMKNYEGGINKEVLKARLNAVISSLNTRSLDGPIPTPAYKSANAQMLFMAHAKKEGWNSDVVREKLMNNDEYKSMFEKMQNGEDDKEKALGKAFVLRSALIAEEYGFDLG